MNVNALVKRGEALVVQNQSAILTAVGVVGTAATAVLSVRAGLKSSEILNKHLAEQQALKDEPLLPEDFAMSTKLKLVAPEFIPPVMTGIATIVAIIMANRVSSKKAAALAAAYGVSQREFQEYKEKVKEKLTGPKEQAIKDEVAQDRVNQNPPPEKAQIIIAGGDVLCLDKFSGRYFYSTVERIKQAELKLNHELLDRLYASATYFYDEIGLEPTDVSDLVGWRNGDGPSLSFSTTETKDNRPCIVFSWDMMPYPDYNAGMH